MKSENLQGSKDKDVRSGFGIFCPDIKLIGDGTDLDDGWENLPSEDEDDRLGVVVGEEGSGLEGR